MTTKELIAEISQTLIAVLIVIGGGLAILSSNPHLDVIVPFMGVVIGFYFGKAISPATASSVVTTTTQAAPLAPAATPIASQAAGTPAQASESTQRAANNGNATTTQKTSTG